MKQEDYIKHLESTIESLALQIGNHRVNSEFEIKKLKNQIEVLKKECEILKKYSN